MKKGNAMVKNVENEKDVEGFGLRIGDVLLKPCTEQELNERIAYYDEQGRARDKDGELVYFEDIEGMATPAEMRKRMENLLRVEEAKQFSNWDEEVFGVIDDVLKEVHRDAI